MFALRIQSGLPVVPFELLAQPGLDLFFGQPVVLGTLHQRTTPKTESKELRPNPRAMDGNNVKQHAMLVLALEPQWPHRCIEVSEAKCKTHLHHALLHYNAVTGTTQVACVLRPSEGKLLRFGQG